MNGEVWLRVVDRVVAGLMLVGFAPVLVATAIAVRLLSGRSPFVAHCRVGWKGQPFWMIKLRTMWPRTPPVSPDFGVLERVTSSAIAVNKACRDPRVTSRFAAWCRAYSFDELPQVLHVLKGEMSLVGPRPLTQAELERYYGEMAAEVLAYRPGMTGLWQILGRNQLSYQQRRRLDVFLVRRYSPRLYWWILTRTPGRVVSGSGAW